MSPKSSRNKRRLIAFLAGLGAVFILMAIAYATQHKGKKDDKPSGPVNHGPVASLEPSPSALKAAVAYPRLGCNNLVQMRSLAAQTGHTLGKLEYPSGNSVGREVYFRQCDYRNIDNGTIVQVPVAQTQYAVLTTHGLDAYHATYRGADDFMTVTPIPASRLPHGVTDGYEFVPASFSADTKHQAPFYNAGAQLRIDNRVVTISFAGFNKLTNNLKADWEYTVAKPVLDAQK